jgi:hypothetical protein
MCILMNSGIKGWSHARYVCEFNNASLLFIANQNEQKDLIGILKFFGLLS